MSDTDKDVNGALGSLAAPPDDAKPSANVITWHCVDCDQRIQGVNHIDCPGKDDRPCKNCRWSESAHYGVFIEDDVCDNFEAVKYAGGASSPKRERELYEQAMAEAKASHAEPRSAAERTTPTHKER